MAASAAPPLPPGLVPLITLRGITKRFGAVRALDGVDLDIRRGETLGLVGHNGAGKSTLVQILIGTLPADGGSLAFADSVAIRHDVRRAASLGIRCVFQELSLCPNLRVFENVRILHHRLHGFGWARRAQRMIGAALDDIFPGHGIDPAALIGDLSIGQRQMVEIARAFTMHGAPARLVILDEPTSSLGARAAAQLLRFIRRATAGGLACIFISHRLKEVLGHTDRVVVMRDGQITAESRSAELSEALLIEKMGTTADDARARMAAGEAQTEAGENAPGAGAPAVRLALPGGAPLLARFGEVVGLAGLDGHGQRAALLRIFAAAQGMRGTSREGHAEIAGRVAYVSGDRPREGIFPLWSVARNLTIGLLERLARGGFVGPRSELALAETWRARLAIRTPDTAQPILSLSGGSQQKVLIARAFAHDARILLLDDPMRGVDIGTKRELFAAIRREAAGGRAILLYTTETEELMHCDRSYVFYRGVISGEIARREFSEERVLRASFAELADAG